jgi:hypothetical protein
MTMTRLVFALTLVFLLWIVVAAHAQQQPRSVFGVDVSGTSTFLVDQSSADAAGAFVERYIAALDAPHSLTMTSVGDEGLARRTIDIRATVTNHRASSPRKLAPQFGGYFRSLPGLFNSGKLKAQDTTSLISFFQSLEPLCKAGNATAIVFSDGLEWSAVVDGRAFATGKVGLPKPDRPFLKGCDVQLLGVGQVRNGLESGGLAARLIPLWRAWLSEAGAESVAVIGSGFAY